MEIEELNLKMSDGEIIRLGIYRPVLPARFVVQIVHGFGEYIEQYETVVAHFSKLGGICLVHDQRGFGKLVKNIRSKQGVLQSYELWLSDILEIRQKFDYDFRNLPWVIFGHSLGGNVVLNVLLKVPDILKFYDKAIIESPWLGLNNEPPRFVKVLAKYLGHFSEKLSIQAPLKMSFVIHDQDKIKAIVNDGIFHTRLSFRIYSQITEAATYALSHANKLPIETLLLGAEEEKIVSRLAIHRFAETSNYHLHFFEVPLAFHMIHMDNCMQDFYAKVDKFLNFDNK